MGERFRTVLSELQTRLAASAERTLPSGVSLIAITHDAVSVVPPDSLRYYPNARGHDVPPPSFAEGEQAEFARNDLAAAARTYARMSAASNRDVRSGALARLARVRRKQHDIDAALNAYEQLETLDQGDVDGLPAPLVALTGRASMFEESGNTVDLRREAAALQRDLQLGRFRLVKAEYEFYSNQASAWLGT